MGLFDTVSGRTTTETEIEQKFAKHPMLNTILQLLTDELSWTTQCTDYYDDRMRIVMVNSDSFCVKMKKYAVKANESGAVAVSSDENEFVFLTYSQFGYLPLHRYAANGTVVNLERVLYLWTTVIQNALKEAFPQGEYGQINRNDSGFMFCYKVPALEMRDWF